MEQKIMEQIDKAQLIVEEKIKYLQERYDNLNKEVFTPEIISMIKVINERYIYEMKLDEVITIGNNRYDSISFKNGDYGNYWIGLAFNRKYRPRILDFHIKEYTDSHIARLESIIETIHKTEMALDFLEDNVEDLISFITMKYKEFTEDQADRMTNLLSKLDYEEEPIKHIKVTVEWL